jgi:hypothetical protein
MLVAINATTIVAFRRFILNNLSIPVLGWPNVAHRVQL